MLKIRGVADTEVAVPIADGQYLVFEAFDQNPSGCDYVRIVDGRDGEELVYWDSNEWREDPVGVMGAIMGAIKNGAGEYK